MLREEIEDLKEKLKRKTEQVNEMFDELNSLKAEKEAYAKQLKQFAQSRRKSTFSYACLKLYPQQFLYMTALSLKDFDCLFACVQPYISAIVYPDCKGYESGQRKLKKRTFTCNHCTYIMHVSSVLPGGGVLPCMGFIGMWGPKWHDFSAILVMNRISILAILVINRI